MIIGEICSVAFSAWSPGLALEIFRNESGTSSTSLASQFFRTPQSTTGCAVLFSCIATGISSSIENYIKVEAKQRSTSEAILNTLTTTAITGVCTYLGCKAGFSLLQSENSSGIAEAVLRGGVYSLFSHLFLYSSSVFS